MARPFTATTEIGRLFALAAEQAGQAIELAQRHGWTDEPAFGVACRALGSALAWQARPEEAEPWIQRGERTALDFAEPDGLLLPFLLHPVPGLLQRQAPQRTAHPALIADILGLRRSHRRPRSPRPGASAVPG